MTRSLLPAAAALVVGALALVVNLPDWLRLALVAVCAAVLVFTLVGLVVRKPSPPAGAGAPAPTDPDHAPTGE